MAVIKPLLFFLFTLFIILAASSSTSNRFDTYEAIFHWNPATCSNRNLRHPCYKVPSDQFSISGLWPTILQPYQVVGPCRGTSFNPKAISGIEFGLRQKWTDIISGNDEELWKKEWESHGTCSEDYLNQEEYFSFAVNSASRYNLLRILENNGVRPTDAVYSKGNVENVLERAIGARPALRCNVNRLSGTGQLHEIVVCYTKGTKVPRRCSHYASTCDHRFEWFPYMRWFYGYFRVFFQWQPATCFNFHSGVQPCSQNPELRFSINGVWAMRRSHVTLLSCTNTTFDNNQISPIQARLDRAWPDLRQRRNDMLWRNEWSNHGTCSEDQFGQREYFSFGVHAFETNDIFNMLRRNNIIPNGREYRKQDVENAIIRSIGVRPYALCNIWQYNNITFRYEWQLHHIILCYDDSGRRRQDCPNVTNLHLLAECPVRFFWNV